MRSITFQNILSPTKTQYVQKWLDRQPMDLIFAENFKSENEKNNESYLNKSKCLPIVEYEKVILFYYIILFLYINFYILIQILVNFKICFVNNL